MGGSSVDAFSHLLPSTRWVGEYVNSVFPFILLVVSGTLRHAIVVQGVIRVGGGVGIFLKFLGVVIVRG